jgi:cytochrome c oxidase subunit 3
VILTLLFLGVVAAVAIPWLLRQGLMEKPWLETGSAPAAVAAAEARGPAMPTARMGLTVFMTVATALMMLLVSAYTIRMGMEDWRPLPQPGLLWANTAVLVLASVALQGARGAAGRGDRDGMRFGVLAGSLAGLLFLAGQILAWKQLTAAGYRFSTNPADSFFYLITAAHGLHVLGGLAALGRTGARLWRGAAPPARLRLGVELCATYWHFLLAAWIVLFGLLAYAPSIAWLYDICSAPFR